MGDNTKIEWSDATWNPVTGCTKVSPGCDNCYAETLAERFRGVPGHYYQNGFDVQLRPDKLGLPLRWTRPRKVFVNSMSDLFHTDIPTPYIARVFGIMAATPHHTYQLLTKRHGRMHALLTSEEFRERVYLFNNLDQGDIREPGGWPLPNVQLGVSVEDQARANLRIPHLIDTPAAVRWISAEPLLGPIDLRLVDKDALVDGGLDWIVVGGESGRNARPMHPDWARQLRDQAATAGIPYLFKQWGEWSPDRPEGPTQRGKFAYLGPHGERFDERNPPHMSPAWAALYRLGKRNTGRHLDGRTHDDYPTSR